LRHAYNEKGEIKMKTQIIRMVTSDTLRLDGLFYEPIVKSNKCIIHVHGTSSDFYRTEYFEEMSSQFTENGFAFLTFNNRGSGLEYSFKTIVDGKIGKSIPIGSRNETFEDCVIDIQTAVEFAKSKGYTEIILQGHSYGCNKVIWYALEKDFAGKIILLAPCDIADIKRKSAQGRVAWKSRNSENVNMFRYRDKTFMTRLSNLKNQIIIQIGTNDAFIDQPIQECIDYLNTAFQNAKLTCHIINDANHNYHGHEKELVSNLTTWIKTKEIKL